MKFGFEASRSSIAPGRVPADTRDIDLGEVDHALRIGVGRSGDHAYVFVGPGQASATALRGQQFSFEPWMDLFDKRSEAVLKDACVLKFWPVEDRAATRDAVAAVFAGLVELALSTPHSLGSAIAAMEALFEASLESRVGREVEIGLAGELLVISESREPSTLAAMWHSRADSLFDFSAQGERLEVKTTTGAERVHWFSSRQLEPIPGVCTTFVSVVMPLVEVGSTIASVFASMTDLSPDVRARIRSVILDVAHEPPEVLSSVVFDRQASAASILHVSPQAVPMPVVSEGVGRMRWEATIGLDATRPGDACHLSSPLGR